MQYQINNMNKWRQLLKNHGGPLIVERSGRQAEIREQHAPFAFISELAATGNWPRVRITPNAVVMQITQPSRISTI